MSRLFIMTTAPRLDSDITLRDYRPSSENRDWEAMYALDLDCFEPAFRFSRRAMRSFAQAPHAITLLLESRTINNAAQLAAFSIAHIEGSTAYVVTLDVASAFRRRGLARRLMAETELRARTAGAHEVALHVFTGNTAAIQLYESLGYNRTGLAENFYARNLDALIYRKKL